MRAKKDTNASSWCTELAGAVNILGDCIDQHGYAVVITLVRRILRGLNRGFRVWRYGERG